MTLHCLAGTFVGELENEPGPWESQADTLSLSQVFHFFNLMRYKRMAQMPFCGRVNETLFTGFYPESRKYKKLNFTLKKYYRAKKPSPMHSVSALLATLFCDLSPVFSLNVFVFCHRDIYLLHFFFLMTAMHGFDLTLSIIHTVSF